MKEGWEYKKLGEVATFTRGLTYSKNDEAEISDNIVLRSNNVDLLTGKLNFDELKYLKPEFLIPEEKKVKKGSLLMCMSNGSKIHLGKVALINDDYPYAFGGFMALVTPNEELNPQFFNYSLLSPEYKDFIKKLSEGANINNIKVKELELFTIPVPPLSEQQSIVDYLNSAFAKIDAMKANAEKALNEAKALFQASLKEMLEPKEGWEEKNLGDICEIIRGKRFVRTDIIENGVPCIHYGDIYTHYGLSVKKTRGCINPELAKKMRFAEKNDVVVVQAGENNWDIGVGVAYFGEEPAAVHDACFILKHKQNPMYISYYLRSYNYHRYLVDYVHEGKICSFLKPALENAPIPLPPFSEQQSIVATLDSLKSKVDRLQANYEKISQECDALKQAILRQVFE